MDIAFGVSWNDAKKRGRLLAFATATFVALAFVPVARQMPEAMGRLVSVIVREDPGAGSTPEQAVESLGGDVGRHIGIINGFVADVPQGGIARLESTNGVNSVTENFPIQMSHVTGGGHEVGTVGAFHGTASLIQADDLWSKGITGAGVDVALIDTGVVPVNGLTGPDKVYHGPDLSFEAMDPSVTYLDTYGHGTHMAGIIAARDDEAPAPSRQDHANYYGIAPDARIVSVKVGNAFGITDVSQVLAAIDWVVQHRNSEGLNIRVLNLSFGTDGVQSYMLDPLTYAAEVAWRSGIVVVAAVGNEGFGSSKLNNPAYDPHIIAVGAADTKGTNAYSDDTIPDFSSRGDGTRNPDFVAPGQSIVSLRNPGSFIDDHYPTGYVSDRFFKGSGTSQSAAVVSGAVALMLQERPNLTPNQVKYLLRATSKPLPAADAVAQGKGMINVSFASSTQAPSALVAAQPFPYSTGTGSLDAARGTMKPEDTFCTTDESGVETCATHVLEGEVDIYGDAFDGRTWSVDSLLGRTWSDGMWMGRTWSGRTWSGRTWSDAFWDGRTWSGRTWSGRTWSGRTWSGRTWSGRTWSDAVWSGRTWSGRTWSGRTWSDSAWAGRTWSGRTWSDDAWSGRTWSGGSWS